MLSWLDSAEPAKAERPAGLPEAASWDPSVDKWEVSPLDAGGARDGDRLLYRADGSLFSRTRFVAGVADGPFFIYHPDGQIAREGRHTEGMLDGVVQAYAPTSGVGEPLRACCVPARAVRLEVRYRAGEYLFESFYDREGRALLSNGDTCPARPPGLPHMAQFDERREGWALRENNVDRFWTVDGRLVEEVENEPGGARRVRSFDAAGELTQEQRFTGDDKRDGTFRGQLGDGEASPYADPRIRAERGSFEAGQATGVWTLLDAAGAVIRTVDRGRPFAAEALSTSPAFSDEIEVEPSQGGAGGWAVAERLIAEGRVREGVCLAARVAARTGARERLLALLSAQLLQLTPALEAARGEVLVTAGDLDVPGVLDALMLGADAAACFRALAAVLPGTADAAVDLVEAALLLAPERRMTHLTRALVRTERGDEAGARADAAVVEEEASDASASLLAYLDATFRPFDLAFAREPLAVDPEMQGVTAPVAQDLEAVRRVAGVYATRLGRLRAAIATICGGAAERGSPTPAWFPPDLSALIPGGPVDLIRETVDCEPQQEGGPPETVEVDEELQLEGLGVPALLGLAQADWTALCWLCWSVGLDRVRLPDAVEPPDELATAVQMSVKRTWRLNDRMTTGGLLAMSKAIPGFAWQGIDVDLLPVHLLPTAAAEYLALRSMFLWLVSEGTLSPFQDDLRAA